VIARALNSRAFSVIWVTIVFTCSLNSYISARALQTLRQDLIIVLNRFFTFSPIFYRARMGSFSPKTLQNLESFLAKLFNPQSYYRVIRKNEGVNRLAKWEYAAIPLITKMRKMGYDTQKQLLDKYGLEGWELVSTVALVVPEGFDMVAYLKREKK
jgi:hypothetical protein